MSYLGEHARARLVSQSGLRDGASAQFHTPTGAAATQLLGDMFAASALKLTTAFTADGVGDIPPVSGPTTLLVVTHDTAGDGIGVAPGNPVLSVGTPQKPVEHTVSTLDVPGDQDYYKVTLEAGKSYQIGMYAKAGGPSGVPVADPYIEILRANGTKDGFEVVTADGGASSPQNNVNSGLDVLLTFEPTVSGTYYINARGFGNAGGPNGDEVGDYELFVNDVTNDPAVYRPYYDVDSPLYSIDWGTQVDGTARNPDGNEGIRPTGNPQGTPDNKGETVGHFGESTEGKNVIKIYFAKPGDVYGSSDPTNPNIPPAAVAVGAKDYEVEAIWTALRQFEKIADIVYVETQSREDADFEYVTYTGTPGPGISLLGAMNPPQEADEGLALFNSGDERWDELNLQQGGFSFVTLVHEFGHGHGLAHPHDSGGHSGEMREVEGIIDTPAGEVPDPTGVWPNYTLGQYDLNQAVYTMMSYMDGWQTSPYGNAPTDVGYGYLGGPMAFDIAVLQDKYGVNEDWATGNDVYTLKDVNAPGTFYSCIWDAGGIDTIVYQGERDANIDLRAATLKYEPGGGGWVSYADGIYGGFTIANHVSIENATGGGGNDTLIGNIAANVLKGGGGKDTLIGDRGSDTLDGGGWADKMYGGAGHDTYFVNHIGDKVIEKAHEGIDTVKSSISYTLGANVENLVLIGPANISGRGNDAANSIRGNDADNWLVGFGGDDVIEGGAGNDQIWGNSGNDRLSGGDGRDKFYMTDIGAANADAILDFTVGQDKIMLARYAFSGVGSARTVSEDAFHAGTAAADASDRIIYDEASGKIFYDADGVGGTAAVLFATVTAGTHLTYASFDIYG
ncbi:MAG TPA: M10 family metallopeptidase C-terminal domain-containing protein [Allosphingosinicella sp.]|jgi:Ca2+-binding RTX toxin-like protein|nr:M10 family metallopeptidase C-terminal domain-containing protein [Allosphingosinicella sp.]